MIGKFLRRIYRALVRLLCRVLIGIFGSKYEKLLLPKVSSGVLLRNFVHQRIFLINSGVKYSVHYTSRVSANMNTLILEDDSLPVLISLAVSNSCYIAVHSGTTLHIGRDTIWAPNICINTANHDLRDREKFHKGSIHIGRNNWLAYGVVITKGVELGDNVTVAANAVVNQSFDRDRLIGGIPARELKAVK